MTRSAHQGASSAIIAGAGIGGLAAALALRDVGIASTLVEKRTALNETGAGIQLSPNASRVLFALGLGPALMRQAVEPEAVRVRGLRNGAELSRLELGEAMRQRYGAPYLVIARSDLHTIMLDALRARTSARILAGRTASAAGNRDDQAFLTIANAAGQQEDLQADLVIGADGVWSQIRENLGGAAPRYRGYHAWRAVIPASALPEHVRVTETGLWLGGGRHVVHYGIAGGRALNVIAVVPSREALPDWSHEADPAVLMGAFAKADMRVRDLLAAGQNWRIHALHDAPPPARWSNGRVALLGDAAHPVLPFLAQGGALAIEDAAALAALLGEAAVAGMAPARALEMYGAARRARAMKAQQQARSNGRIYHMRAPLSLARNFAMRRLGGGGVLARYDWLYGWQAPQSTPNRAITRGHKGAPDQEPTSEQEMAHG